MIEKFSKIKTLNLNIDFARFDAKNWCIFLNSCKSVISSEAGSYFVDIDYKIIRDILRKIQKKNVKVYNSKE